MKIDWEAQILNMDDTPRKLADGRPETLASMVLQAFNMPAGPNEPKPQRTTEEVADIYEMLQRSKCGGEISEKQAALAKAEVAKAFLPWFAGQCIMLLKGIPESKTEPKAA